MKGNAKCKNSLFEPPFGGLRGNAQGSSMARGNARCQLPISDNWIFFASSHDCGTIKRNLSKSASSDVGGSLWAHISGGRGMSSNEFWRQKTRVPGLSRGVVCVLLSLGILIQYRHVIHTDTQTDRQTDTLQIITVPGLLCSATCDRQMDRQIVTTYKVNHKGLFTKLMKRHIPTELLELL